MCIGNRIFHLARLTLAGLLLPSSGAVLAGKADVVDATITALGGTQYRIDASVLHEDTGWDHYANRWDVLAPDGTELGVRELAHPHVGEQPFTRSLTVEIPDGIDTVTIRANDSVHELGGKTFELDVPTGE